jgi:hypothetical protein
VLAYTAVVGTGVVCATAGGVCLSSVSLQAMGTEASMLIGMLWILLTWMLLLAVCCGIGFSIQRLFGFADLSAELVFSGFWLGWSLLIIALQILHLAVPVDLRITLAVLIFGMAGLVLNSTSIVRLLRGRAVATLSMCAALCPLFVWLANRAMGPIRSYDAGLYHLSSIRWISSYPIVPGLGNLHGRLAFNSSYFLFQALLDVGFWRHMSHHLAGGLLIAVAFLQIGLCTYRVIVRWNRCQMCDLLSIVFLVPMIHRSFVDSSTTSPDLPVFVLGFAVGVQLCRALFEHTGVRQLIFDAFLITTFSAIGISIKPSFSAFGCVSALVALGKLVSYAGRRLGRRDNLIRLALVALLPILVSVPWLIRGVIASGYPAYPSTVGAFDVEWKVEREQTIMEAESIRSWARQPYGHPDNVLAGWDWLIPWLQRTALREVTLWSVDIALPFLLGIMVVLLMLLNRNHGNGRPRRLAPLLLPSVAALAFWFLTAPDCRFVGAAVWLFGGGTAAWAMKRYQMSKPSAYVALLLLPMTIMVVGADVLRYGAVVGPGLEHGFHPIPEVEMYEYVTDSGLALYVPAEGDQCWDAPLPSTPYPRPDLRLRTAGDLGSGFVITPP